MPRVVLMFLRSSSTFQRCQNNSPSAALGVLRGERNVLAQHLLADFHLAHLDFIRIATVRLHTHPVRPGRLGPPHQVIARAEPLASAKIGDPRTVLLKQHIHCAPEHVGNQEITAKIGIRQHHITFDKALLELPEQTVFTRALAFVGPMAASSTAPLESAITPTRRASGKPTPGSCCPCWGKRA